MLFSKRLFTLLLPFVYSLCTIYLLYFTLSLLFIYSSSTLCLRLIHSLSTLHLLFVYSLYSNQSGKSQIQAKAITLTFARIEFIRGGFALIYRVGLREMDQSHN